MLGHLYQKSILIKEVYTFTKLLLKKAGVAVSPGIGFGKYGDKHVRISLVENEHRIRQAARNIKNNIKIIMSIKKIGIGIVGLGTVGSGLIEIIQKNKIFTK